MGSLQLCIILWLLAGSVLTEPKHNFIGAYPGRDKNKLDMHGTEFVFPHPPCYGQNNYYQVQMVPLNREHVIVAIADGLQEQQANDDIRTGTIVFGDLRNGRGATAVLHCGTDYHNATGRIEYGTVMVNATAEIMLHVLYRNDSFSVPPLYALGTQYVALTLTPDDLDYNHLLLISPMPNRPARVTIKPPGMKSTAQVVDVTFPDQYVFRSKSSLTGYTISANRSIFVVISSVMWEEHLFHGRWHMATLIQGSQVLLEHLRPVPTWGKYYVLMVPKDCGLEIPCSVDIRLAAFCGMNCSSVVALLQDQEKLQLSTNGTYSNISGSQVPGDSLVVLGDGAFQLMATFRSNRDLYRVSRIVPTIFYKIGFLHWRRPYFLSFLASSAPLEQYYADPCVRSYDNWLDRRVVIAGLAAEEEKSQSFPVVTDMRGNRSLPSLWLRSDRRENAFMRSLASQKFTFRLWSHETWLLLRHVYMYYIDGAANLYVLNKPCYRNETHEVSDGKDNNCNGLVDEQYNTTNETKPTDLDVGGPVDFSEGCRHPMSINYSRQLPSDELMEPEPIPDDRKATTEVYQDGLVVGSVVTAVVLFILFFAIVAGIDAYERYKDPAYKFHVFF